MAVLCQFDAGANAFGAEFDEGGFGVADFVGLQAGQIVGDDLRQHGDDAVGQIDAGGALVGFAIERRFLADEVRDVGDVHAQPPETVFEMDQRDGVVEIAGVDGVDGDDGFGGQIDAAARSIRRTFRPAGGRLPARRREIRRAGCIRG